LRLKRELGETQTWVLGYSNDITVYVPTKRVLQEGGFEPCYSMILVGAPCPFADTVEETLANTVRSLVTQVKGQSRQRA
jgi:hypothetical protein